MMRSAGQRLAASLAFAEYRQFWLGTMANHAAVQMGNVVLGWQVLVLTGSATWVGAVGFANNVPLLLVSPVAGLLADGARPQRIMIMTAAASALACLALSYLAGQGAALPWHLVAVSFIAGSMFAIFAPARSTLMARLVPDNLVINAALVQYASTRVMAFIGPTISGILLASAGVPLALAVTAALFAISGGILLATHCAKPRATVAVRRRSLQGISEAFAYVREDSHMRELVLLGLVTVPLGMTYQNLLAVFARDVLGAGAATYGLMVGIVYLGTALTGFGLAALGDQVRKGPAVLASALLSGLGLAVFAFSRTVVVSVAMLLLLGIVNGVFLNLTTALMTALPRPALRGRMMALWGMVWGLAPFATLLSGVAVERWGVTAVLVASGLLCAAFAGGMMLARTRLLAMP